MKSLIISLRTLIISCLKNKLKMIDRTKRKIRSTRKQSEETLDLVSLRTLKKELDHMKLSLIMQVSLCGFQELSTLQQVSFELYGSHMMIFHRKFIHQRLQLEEF